MPRNPKTTAKKSASATVTKPAKKRAGVPRKTAAKKDNAEPTSGREPTDDEIRLRAYFISEHRHRAARPGDSSADWIEARRQLIAESGPN